MTPEEYAKLHQVSFRKAFDFLNSHFPPGEGMDWWKQAGEDIVKVSTEGENKLLDGLLVGVFDYLELEWKRRRIENGGKTED